MPVARTVLDLEMYLVRPTTVGDATGLRWPIGYEHTYRKITQTYGQLEFCRREEGSAGVHRGLDIDAAEEGTPVYAVLPGFVTHVRNDGYKYSGVVVLTRSTEEIDAVGELGTPLSLKYLHFDPTTISVKRGDVIEAGHMLGHAAYWYDVQPPHLHFSVLKDAVVEGLSLPGDDDYAILNPLTLLSPQANADAKPMSASAQLFVCSNDKDGAVVLEDLDGIGEGEVDIVVSLRDTDGLSDVVWHAPYEVALTLTAKADGRARTYSHRFHDDLYVPAKRVYLLDDDWSSSGCWRSGEYVFRFVMTNDSAAAGVEPQQEHHWDAKAGDYDVRFAMRDVAGNTYISSAETIRV